METQKIKRNKVELADQKAREFAIDFLFNSGLVELREEDDVDEIITNSINYVMDAWDQPQEDYQSPIELGITPAEWKLLQAAIAYIFEVMTLYNDWCNIKIII